MQDVFTAEKQGRLRTKLVKYLGQLTRPLQDAEDLAHVVLMELQAEIGNGGPRIGVTCEQWAMKRAKAKWSDRLRRERCRQKNEADVSERYYQQPESPDEQLIYKEENKYVRQAISDLSENERKVMELVLEQRKSRREIAEALCMSEVNLNVIYHRTVIKLAKAFEQWRKT